MNNDIATTRTLLHEAIPITGTIASGTYDDHNIKNYSHGMFQSVYDYPYLSSSANHIFDITVGLAASSSDGSGSYYGEGDFGPNGQYSKKRNIYDQMAQVLNPYDISGNIKMFDKDGNLATSDADSMWSEAIFVNFARLLTKDEVKKGTFSISFLTGGTTAANGRAGSMTLSDYGASSSFLVNSPTGEYGLLYTASSDSTDTSKVVGHVYYQAGIAVVTPYIFSENPLEPGGDDAPFGEEGATAAMGYVLTASSIDTFADGVRNRLVNIEFNNTTELNSTIYFCRANTGDYNYSANPTYLSSSKIRVKGDNPFAQPVSYITTIGLYSPNNELLAVAKLSEPLKKTPSNELTLRVRLDY